MEKVIVYGTKNCAMCRGAVKLAKAVCSKVEYKNIEYGIHYEDMIARGEKVNTNIIPHIWVIDGESEFYVGSYFEFKEYCYNTQIPAIH